MGMMDDGYGVLGGGTNGPASTQKIDFMISVDSTAQINRQVEIHEGGGRTGAQDGTFLVQRLGARLVRGQAGGAADRSILAGQFACEQFLSRGIVSDFLICQQG